LAIVHALIGQERIELSAAALEPTDLPAAEPSTSAAPRSATAAWDLSCRVLDLTVSLITLVLLSPVLVLIAIAIRLESPGPAIFRQRRVGRDQREFTVNKFRTMRKDVSSDVHQQFVLKLIAGDAPPSTEGKPRFKLAVDDRVTRVGRFLRKSSLDELPQLWNVVRGEMSLVGPRPPIPYEVDHYPQHWFERFEVKPGLTGLWQVSGRSELTLEEMIALDNEYVQRRSLRLNIEILLRTIPAVLRARGAS
jgi:lipopolysaccharide/colanic/teichoic acid biosynthesis glycosyltransferase